MQLCDDLTLRNSQLAFPMLLCIRDTSSLREDSIMDLYGVANFIAALYYYASMLYQVLIGNGRPPCPELYRRYSVNHTFCKTSSCIVLRQGISEEDKKIILDMHNKFRSKVAVGNETQYHVLPSAANMMEMEWDNELARVAQAHANLCVFDHDKPDERAVDNFVVGQNLWIDTYEKNWSRTGEWYTTEISFFLPEYVTLYVFNKEYAHLSQMIWATTWKIGCGLAMYNDSEWEYSLYTCNYGPAGNIPESPVYTEGLPCSKCPRNTKCSSHYTGLCKSETPNGPQREKASKEEYLLYCSFSPEDPEECDKVETIGSKNFSTRTLYAGNLKTIVLEANESLTIGLGEAQDDKGICPFVYARFGPDEAENAVGSVIEMSILQMEYSFLMEFCLPSQGYYFRTYGVTMLYNSTYQMNVTLKVYPEATPQYFDIAAWGITRGECNWFL